RRVRAELEKLRAETNRAVGALNLSVPQLSLQRLRLHVHDILAVMDTACRHAYPGVRGEQRPLRTLHQALPACALAPVASPRPLPSTEPARCPAASRPETLRAAHHGFP